MNNNIRLIEKPMPVLEFRHMAKIEFNNAITVDKKMDYLKAVREEFNIEFTDIVSGDNMKDIVAKFTAVEEVELNSEPVEMHDRCRIELYNNHMYMKVEMNFDRLIEIHNFTETYFDDNVRDLLIYHNENPKGTPSA